MLDSFKSPLALTGRVLLALMFVMSGFSKLGNIAGTAGYSASGGLPLPNKSTTEPAAPVLGSAAANTTRLMRACSSAIAHIAHGSSVTYIVHSSKRHWPSWVAASRNASTSA